jgi:Fe-S-cluster-containing dehydrogenase component
MKLSRRQLIKIGGFTLLGLSAKPALDVFSKVDLPEPSVVGPSVGKRWAMAVDVKKCWSVEGCTDCIDACHRAHNVPSFPNVKEEIKWIWTVPFGKAFPDQDYDLTDKGMEEKPLVLLCNHCESPPCVRYCPTKATWQREDGIVMMDYHRCIGCRYCMAGCPYGSRSFNWRDPRPFIKNPNIDFPTRTRGVVEKCNFCEERLSQGLLPACVEACKEKALTFGNIRDSESEIRRVLQKKNVLQRMPELGTKPKVYYIV